MQRRLWLDPRVRLEARVQRQLWRGLLVRRVLRVFKDLLDLRGVAEEEVEMEPRDPQEHPDLLQIRGRRVHLDLQDRKELTDRKE